MSPEGFLEFRDPLAPASGFQSRQFRAIEWLSGERDTWPGDGEPPPGASLYEAFSAGLELPGRSRRAAGGARRRSTATTADPLRAAWHEVAELLIDHDEGIARWRHHHALMAAREIGTRPGTGGSPGRAVPAPTVDRRFFPELWDVGHAAGRALEPRQRPRGVARARATGRRAPRAAPGTFASVQRRGCRSASSSSSQASGVATGAPGIARTAYGATVVCP